MLLETLLRARQLADVLLMQAFTEQSLDTGTENYRVVAALFYIQSFTCTCIKLTFTNRENLGALLRRNHGMKRTLANLNAGITV